MLLFMLLYMFLFMIWSLFLFLSSVCRDTTRINEHVWPVQAEKGQRAESDSDTD